METRATLRGVRLSVDKGRLVADLIRGKKVDQALNILQFTQKKAAVIIKKVLESAIANAEHNDGADIDELKGLVAAHAAATGSTRAKLILSTWDVQLPKFIKVMPRDYKRALGLAAKAKAERSAA